MPKTLLHYYRENPFDLALFLLLKDPSGKLFNQRFRFHSEHTQRVIRTALDEAKVRDFIGPSGMLVTPRGQQAYAKAFGQFGDPIQYIQNNHLDIFTFILLSPVYWDYGSFESGELASIFNTSDLGATIPYCDPSLMEDLDRAEDYLQGVQNTSPCFGVLDLDSSCLTCRLQGPCSILRTIPQ